MNNNKKKRLYFIAKVIIVLYGIIFSMFVLFFDAVYPKELPFLGIEPGSYNITTDLLKSISPFIYLNYINFYHLLFAVAYMSVALISIILLPGRSVGEIFGLVFCFLIPNPRKADGLIFDQKADKPLPFSTIYLEKINDDGSTTFITQSIADLDGRYKLNVENPNSKVRITVKSQGYEDFTKDITPNILTRKMDFILDIPMKPLDHNHDQFNSPLHRISFEMSNSLVFIVYILSLFLLIVCVSEIGLVLPFVTLFELVVYGIPFIWNTIAIYRRLSPKIGKIIDSSSGGPIEGAIVKVYDKDKKQIASFMSNKKGIVDFNIKSGEYDMDISKVGYKGDNEVGTFQRLKVSNRGYLESNIFLTPKESLGGKLSSSSTLLNPFS